MKLRFSLKMLLVEIIFEWKVTINQKKKTKPFLGIFADS